MEALQYIPTLLGFAVLAPLFSFWLILILGRWMGQNAAYVAVTAIITSAVLSFASLGIWLSQHSDKLAQEHAASYDGHHGDTAHGDTAHGDTAHGDTAHGDTAHGDKDHGDTAHGDGDGEHASKSHDHEGEHHQEQHHDEHHAHHGPASGPTGDWWVLGTFGSLRLTIGYYVDSLTIVMFCMVSLIATLIHFYAIGYMHDELEEDHVDHEVTLADGSHLHRPGRFPRFFQYLSLFCFSMLGLVIAGNIAMTFVFWELVGICSYFLIGFYIERKSASTAANKAFIVNRVGDFGMIIGLMAIWSGVGTFNYGDIEYDGQVQPGMFSQVRPAEEDHQLTTPDGMVMFAAREKVAQVVAEYPADTPIEKIRTDIQENYVPTWRNEGGYGYWMLIVAGLGIFCGCVGKSAQFPLHTWLPDAMEGPTPVSALVHSATMVAAGVFLVGRFYPVFTPEVLLVIAVVGTITLFMAATIAITATDIKRVLAYSTVSQLGYMMMALGVGAWMAGLMHLVTHAFFKSLLFMCSGSVIHAVHSNEMTDMGGLRKKMPWTAYTMLVGCLAIAGAGIPFVIGMSGYYSKDFMLEQAYNFGITNGGWRTAFFWIGAGGAAITAFYMFRLWYMTFAGKPRDEHRYEHAHESPKVMYVPLVILSVFAVGVAWPVFGLSLENLLEMARPAGVHGDVTGRITQLTWPDEHSSHVKEIKIPVTWIAFFTALGGFALATVFYGVKYLDPEEVKRTFKGPYRVLVNKYWFDELYDFLFVKPTLLLSRMIAGIDRQWIDGLIDGTARVTEAFARWWDGLVDRGIVDGLVNLLARWTYSIGLWLRGAQTGRLRQYVMFIVLGTVALFVLISFFGSTTAQSAP